MARKKKGDTLPGRIEARGGQIMRNGIYIGDIFPDVKDQEFLCRRQAAAVNATAHIPLEELEAHGLKLEAKRNYRDMRHACAEVVIAQNAISFSKDRVHGAIMNCPNPELKEVNDANG